jgi:transposase
MCPARRRAAGGAVAPGGTQRVIAERFGVDLHAREVGKLLKKLGFSKMSARPRYTAQHERIVEAFQKRDRG